MNRYQAIVACVVVVILLVAAVIVWRMSATSTEDKVVSSDTPSGQPENPIENATAEQNTATDNVAEEEGLAERRTNAVNDLIEIIGKSFLEDPIYSLDGFLISASADELDYYDWSDIYYDGVSVDGLDGVFGSNAGRSLGGYASELAGILNRPHWHAYRNSSESDLSLWRQFLFDNSIMPTGENEANVYIWGGALCHDQLPLVAGGSGQLTVAFVYSDGNSSVCREITFEGPQCLSDDPIIVPVYWGESDPESVLAGGRREHQCP